MTSDPFDLEAQLRQHGRSLRRLAFELVHDPAAADDAVQETWLRTLRHPPERPAQAHGWLATVLRHVVFRARRGERRRERREQMIARDPVAADHAEVVARTELAERVLVAVRALDEPYGSTVWQRFFEDLPPREIAVRSGVPVATVKSRLQRGLQQLRERLGEGGESDWRGALALAFGFGAEKGTAAAGTVAVVAGGVCMAVWSKFAGAALAAVVVMWLWWPVAPFPDVTGATAAGGEAVAVQAGPTIGRPAATPSEEVPPIDRERVTARSVLTSTPHAVLRGRCVDPTGRALAGCAVTLRGRARNDQELDVWLLDHPGPSSLDLKQATGADGVFVFTFEPPPPFQFFAAVEQAGCFGVTARWPRIAPDARIDVGDVVLRPGVQLTGRLVDERENPVARERIVLSSTAKDAGFNEGTFMAGGGASAETGEDGRFAFRGLFAPGGYELKQQRAAGGVPLGKVDLPADRATVDVTLVAPSVTDGTAISGHVIDERGQPVARAFVVGRDGKQDLGLTDSRSNGTFLLARPDGAPASVTIDVRCDGYEPGASDTSVTWGSSDVEIVIRQAPTLVVRVTGPDEQPVDQYTVRVLPYEGNIRSDAVTVRARGPFEDGTTSIRGITSGKWTVMVEFPSASPLLMILAPLDVEAGVVRRLDLRAELPVARILRLVDATGTPIAGAHARVCDLIDGVFDDTTYALPREQLFVMMGAKRACIYADAVTDADGSAELRGPASRAIGLALLGPGHIPMRLPDVWLGAPGELQITVAVGAHLKGRIVPLAVIDELRRLQGLAPGAAFPEGSQPSIELTATIGARHERQPSKDDEARFAIGEAGDFDIPNLKPGAWTLRVRRDVSIAGGSMRTAFDVASVELRDGATTTVELDLSAILPGTIEGTVRHNGRLLANANVHLECTYHVDGRSGPQLESHPVRTDAEGAFSFVGRTGTYRATLWDRRDPRNGRSFSSASSATVAHGQTTHQAFEIWSGMVKVTVRDASGAPAAGVTLLVDDGSGTPPKNLPATDAQGSLDVELTATTVTILVLPERLQSREAQAVARQNARLDDADPLAPYRLTLGTVTVRADQPTAVELRLPPEWRQ
jgi:RNA polymerase sigma-70 factor (ECF subfamily)